MVRQCFDMLNTFARDATSITNATKGFCAVLDPWPIKVITEAFLDWTKESSVMPAPADIAKLCAELEKKETSKGAGFIAGEVRWTQIIRNWDTDEELAVYGHGNHLSPLHRDKMHGSRAYCRMERERQ